MALLDQQERGVPEPDSLAIIPRLRDSGSSIATSLAANPSVVDLPEQYRNTTEAVWAVYANSWMHMAQSRQAMFVYVCLQCYTSFYNVADLVGNKHLFFLAQSKKIGSK